MSVDRGQIQTLCRDHVDLVAWVERDTGQQLRREGNRWRGLCPFHEERTPSFCVYAEDQTYHCYGCGAHGDAVRYVRERTGCDFLDSLRMLAREWGYWPDGLTDPEGLPVPHAKPPPLPRRVKTDRRRKWRTVLPVPQRVESLAAIRPGWETYVGEAHRRLPALAVWAYRDAAGQLLCYDVRFEWLREQDWYADGHTIEDTETGERHLVSACATEEQSDCALVITWSGLVLPADRVRRVRKAPVTYTWCENIETSECRWYPRPPPRPFPLYGLDRIAAHPTATILVAEGAKAADAAHDRFAPDYVGVSWRGGTQTVSDFAAHDWGPVCDRDVVLWPDADQQGITAMRTVAAHCRRAGAASVRMVDVPQRLPKGWDLADA